MKLRAGSLQWRAPGRIAMLRFLPNPGRTAAAPLRQLQKAEERENGMNGRTAGAARVRLSERAQARCGGLAE